MNRDLDSLRSCLENIIEAIDNVQLHTKGIPLEDLGMPDHFTAARAVVYELVLIGETLHRIQGHSPEFAEKYADLKLDAAYKMRNIMVHAYGVVDFCFVVDTVARDLPVMREKFVKELEALDADNGKAPASGKATR